MTTSNLNAISSFAFEKLNTANVVAEKAKTAPVANDETAAKTNSVWLRYAGYLAIASSVAAAALTAVQIVHFPVGVVLAVVTLVAGLVALSKSQGEQYNYADAEALKQIQEAAKKATLGETLKAHGLANIFQYAILTPADFKDKYAAAMKNLTLPEVVRNYTIVCATQAKVEKALGEKAVKFEVPSPKEQFAAAVAKFDEKTTLKELQEFVGAYDFDKLVEFGVISKNQKAIIEGTLNHQMVKGGAPKAYENLLLKEERYVLERNGESVEELNELLNDIRDNLETQLCDSEKEEAEQLAKAAEPERYIRLDHETQREWRKYIANHSRCQGQPIALNKQRALKVFSDAAEFAKQRIVEARDKHLAEIASGKEAIALPATFAQDIANFKKNFTAAQAKPKAA